MEKPVKAKSKPKDKTEGAEGAKASASDAAPQSAIISDPVVKPTKTKASAADTPASGESNDGDATTKKVVKKVKAESKKELGSKDQIVEPSSPGSAKLSKDIEDVDKPFKPKAEKRKSRKLDGDGIVAVKTSGADGSKDAALPVSVQDPKDAGKMATSTSSDAVSTPPPASRTKSRPKSMMVSPKELSSVIASPTSPSATTGDEDGALKKEGKKKSGKHMSVAAKLPKVEGSASNGSLPDFEGSAEAPVPVSAKLKSPSRENSRSELEPHRASPSAPRRKSVGSVSRGSKVSSSTDLAIKKDPNSKDSPAPHSAQKEIIVTSASPVSNGARSTSATSDAAHPEPLNLPPLGTSISSSAPSPTTQSTSARKAPPRPVLPPPPQPVAASAHHDVVSAHHDASSHAESPKGSDKVARSTSVSSDIAQASASHAPNGTSSQNRDNPTGNRAQLAKTTSQDSDTSSKGSSRITLDREQYLREKSELSRFKRGYDHYRAKFKDLENAVIATGGALPPGSPEGSVDLSENDLVVSSLASDAESIIELQRQVTSLNQRNVELTALIDAISLKFKLTMENVGLRMDNLESKIAKVQQDHTTFMLGSLPALDSTVANRRGSADLSALQAGSRASLGLDSSPLPSPNSASLGVDPSPRSGYKRGSSQKDFGTAKRTVSGQVKGPSPTPPAGLPSTTSTTALQAHSQLLQAPTSTKDLNAYFSSFLVDLTTLNRKVIVPLLSQPGDALDKRTRVVVEMLDTEQKYIFGIEVLMTNWEKPLVAYASLESKIPLNEVKGIFGDGWLQFMVNNNVTYLCARLEERLKDWNETSTVGDIFVEFEPYIHPYKRYCSKYKECLNIMTSLAENNAKFKKALEFFDAHCFGFNGLTLRDYLITPVQRVPRYNLLLRDLLNCTPESHPDHALLTTALQRISTTATDINEGIRQAESQLKMREISERGNGFELLTKGNSYRLHIKSGQVDVLVDLLERRRNPPNKRGELIIFNDLIVGAHFVSRKAAQQEYSIPTNLAWIITDLTESPEDLAPLLDGCPRQNAFLIRGPESLWLVGIRKLADFNSFMDTFQAVIGCTQAELAKGPRKGKYEFLRLPGSYDGSWLDGEFHGAGIYVKTDGTLFDGHWDANFKAGFGNVTQGGVGQYISGWKNNRPESDVAPFKEHNLWDGRSDLTERDWAILLTGAKDVTYKKDQKVTEQGLPNSSLYKIKSGKCRVEKETSEGRKTLVVLPAGAYFGDTSVLPMMRTATADVVCDTPTADIHVIEVSILFEILKNDPSLAMRFFRQLARTLASRLRSLHQTPSSKAVDKKKRSQSSGDLKANTAPEGEESTGQSSADASYCEKFDLPAGEVIIKELSAALKGVIKKYGRLYLSQKFLCFESHVFGMSSKEVISLERVTKVEHLKKKYVQITTKGKSKFEFALDNSEELYGLLSSMASNAAPTVPSEDSSRHLHPSSATASTDKSDDAQTASSEDSGAAKSHAHARRKTTYTTLTVADETDAGSLTRADWTLLQQGFQCNTYTKDQPIIEQGTTHSRLFQIARGKCRIQIKSGEGEPTVVGFLNPGQLFGEISFLDSSAATASVIASDDSVEVYVIEGYFINILFVKYPELAGRFFAYIAGVIASRLNEREASRSNQNKQVKKPRPSSRNMTPLPSHLSPPPTQSTGLTSSDDK